MVVPFRSLPVIRWATSRGRLACCVFHWVCISPSSAAASVCVYGSFDVVRTTMADSRCTMSTSFRKMALTPLITLSMSATVFATDPPFSWKYSKSASKAISTMRAVLGVAAPSGAAPELGVGRAGFARLSHVPSRGSTSEVR